MFITPSFKKSLIVEQFQGNYLKINTRENDHSWNISNSGYGGEWTFPDFVVFHYSSLFPFTFGQENRNPRLLNIYLSLDYSHHRHGLVTLLEVAQFANYKSVRDRVGSLERDMTLSPFYDDYRNSRVLIG